MNEKYYENQKFENIKLIGEVFENYEFFDCTFYFQQTN